MNPISRFSFYTGIHPGNRHRLGIALLVVAAACYEWFDSGLSRLFLGPVVEAVASDDQVGFQPVPCWFDAGDDWPDFDCYHMQVPEVHGDSGSRIISFPVVVFHADTVLRYRNPLLHLGAGGPGSAMGLDSSESVERVWRYFSRVSIDQGRDLYVVDPRGAGLARPALVCGSAVQEAARGLTIDLDWREEQGRLTQEYGQCIRDYQGRGVELGAYNSVSVARDMELMREKSDVDRWVLYGVSYAALYAQVLAREFPGSVEAMILDSAVMAGTEYHEDFVTRAREPYDLLRDQCRQESRCRSHPLDFLARIEALRRQFNEQPRISWASHPYTGDTIRMILNGNRLTSVLLVAMYDERFLSEVVAIVRDLENGRLTSVEPYVDEYLAYLLDARYADISAEAHYCHDTRPFLDLESMRQQAMRHLRGVVRHATLAGLAYGDHCDRIDVGVPDPVVSERTAIEIPTLFLHGTLDTVTPITDVIRQQHLYRHGMLLRFDVSHDVFSAHECAHRAAARFVEDPDRPEWQLYCQ